ncbi:hypothetical protein GGR58DRAFT_16795 [Xylaria digitata]|nr:hypothetical protein GGR58DRAFT_16795 [Xylaria digitata]
MVAHKKKTTLGGIDNLSTSSQRVFPEDYTFQIDARCRKADTKTRKIFRREAMGHADALFAQYGLLAAASSSRSARTTSNSYEQDAPHPPPPPDPPVPNPPPPKEL